MLIFIDYNNLRRFMEIKSLSSKHVRWAQELSHYHFQIDYCQGKANGADNVLSQYLQQSAEEEKTLHGKNVKIWHRLSSSLARVFDLLVSQLSSSQLSPLHQILIYRMTIFP